MAPDCEAYRGVFEVGDKAVPFWHARGFVPVHLHPGSALVVLLDDSTLGKHLQEQCLQWLIVECRGAQDQGCLLCLSVCLGTQGYKAP